jgi:biotin carboxylase
MMMPSERHGDDTVLILYGSGSAAYREYVLQSVARAFPLWLFAPRAPTWEEPYLAGHTVVDTLSIDQALSAAQALARRRRLAGIFTYEEVRVHQAATVATALGLPSSTPEAVLACRDKHLSRKRMDDGGVPQALSVCVGSLAEAHRAAEQIGYPVIVKPRGLAGSEGVGLARSPAELSARVDGALAAHFAEVPRFEAGLLVEEYLDGPEISVDSVVVEGRCQPVFVARKQLDMPPTFEETGHVVSAMDPLLHDPELAGVLQRAHRALGYTHGITHTELRLTRRGPRIVEVNGRLGGDLIPYLGQLATGVDLGLAGAELASGRAPDVELRRRCVAAIRFLYAREDLRLSSVSVDRRALPPGVWEVRPLAEPGRELRLPPRAYVSGRAALAIAVGPDESCCQKALSSVGEAVRITGAPLVEGRAA